MQTEEPGVPGHEGRKLRMAKTILDYMEWRGDLSFQQVELGEVDALIFSWIIYYTMENLKEKGIDPAGLTVRQLAETHVREFGPLKIVDPMKKPFPTDNAELLLKAAAETERFGNVEIEDFAAIAGKISGAQYAAASFLLDDGRRVVAYRGTDTTLAGWKENCRMAFEENVPAQLLSTAYLEKLMDGRETYICGHSKGGNLTMYAALKCREKTESLLKGIYNFDGPGFCFDWKDTEKYRRLKERIVTIVPEATIVGMLLDHDDNYQVVRSEMTGVLQHNAFCWHVCRAQFVRGEGRTKVSLAVEKTMKDWLKDLSQEERKEFVQMTFGLFEDIGIVETQEITDDLVRKGQQLLKGMAGWTPKQKDRIGRLIVEMLRQCGYPVPAAMLEKLFVKGEKE